MSFCTAKDPSSKGREIFKRTTAASKSGKFMSYITIKPSYTRRSIDKYIGEKRDCRINVSVEERERIQP